MASAPPGMTSPRADRLGPFAWLRVAAGLALLAAGQLTWWIAMLIAAWDWRAGGNSYQTGRIGTVIERLFPIFWVLSAAGTALAACRLARREGRPARPAVVAAVLVTAAVGTANYATDWRLLGLPVHAVRGALGEATFAAVGLAEIALALLLLVRRRVRDDVGQ
jgi:hypothetical protein